MGHICVASYTVPWQVLEYQDTICLNKSSDISAANKWYTFKYKNPQGNSVAYAAELYCYPNAYYLNTNYYLTITG